MNLFLQRYKSAIRCNCYGTLNNDIRDLHYWQDELFCNFLVYCLPVSLIALIPGVFLALRDGFPIIAIIDLFVFGIIAIVTFSPYIRIKNRKIATIGVFYLLAIFLINTLGYLGPGIFYLFFITVISALIFPIRVAYLSVFFNAALLLMFGLIIALKLFDSALIHEYTPGTWIAFSVNLIFASIVIVLLIDKIFESLQSTIAKKTQLQLRYQQIFDKSPLPMWLFDTDNYMFVDVNEAAIRHYGYTREEFLAMTIMDIRYAKNIAETAELVQANKISGLFYGGNSQHIKKNGEAIFVQIESNLLNLDGREVRLVQATDITTQVEHHLEVFNYHKKIEESESNLRALFDSAIDAFVLLDSRGTIKLFNPKALASMEFNKDQSAFEIGHCIFDYVISSRMAYFKGVMERVYGGETIDYDRMFRSEGSVIWIRYTVTPVRENGRITGACITGRDVTERKFYLRSVEEQNRIFREISWMQSHMVRAPLANILGLLPMLNNEVQAQERSEIVDYINKSATELDNIIKEITKKSDHIMDKYPAPKEND